MNLFLFRHGQAYDIGTNEITSDKQRTLTEKGKKRTRYSAFLLKKLCPKPDLILSSPFDRAAQTAQIIKNVYHNSAEILFYDQLCPDSSCESIFKILKSLKKTDYIIVGHMPSLSFLVSALLSGAPHTGIALKKAGFCRLSFTDYIEAGHGTMDLLLNPSSLKSISKIFLQ